MSKLSLFQERLKLLKIDNKPQRIKLTLTAIIFTASVPVGLSQTVFADQFDAQINSLRQQNNNVSAAQGALEVSEETLAAKVNSLRASISELENQIKLQQARSDELKQKIAETEIELARQREVLGVSIKQVYLDEQVTTLEKVASSKDWSDYADKEQYNSSVKTKINQTLEQIKKLKKQQEEQKAEVEKILSEQKARQSQLAAAQAESSRLLSLNQSQQAEYDKKIGSNNAKIAALKREQARVNARGFVGAVRSTGTGSYPWPNVPFPNTMVDPWGMYKRQCVSYTAWKVASTGRHMPYWGGRGNAKLWDDNARAAGIPVSYSPRVGDVAVSNAGTYGHVMYVEAVHGDGTISISQYNASWDGRYSEGRRSTSGLVFIHF